MRLLLLSLLSSLLSPALVFAQSSEPTAGGQLGAVLGFAFEGAGYKAQELILQQLLGFIRSWGLLIYVAAAGYALYVAITERHFDKIIWLVMGPVFFFFVVRTTTVAGPIEWRLSTGAQQSAVRAEVSWLFALFDGLYSRFINSIESVFASTQSRELSKNFIVREEVLSQLLSTRVQQGGLSALLQSSILECSREMDSARIIALGNRDPAFRATPEFQAATQYFNQDLGGFTRFTAPSKSLKNLQAKEYVERLLSDIQNPTLSSVQNPIMNGCLAQSRAFLSKATPSVSEALSSGVSCEQLWCWMGLGFTDEFSERREEIRLSLGLNEETFQSLLKEITLKLTRPKVTFNASGTPLQNVRPVDPDPSLIPVIIGGYIIREGMKGANIHHSTLAQIADHSGLKIAKYNFDLRLTSEQRADIARRGMQHQMAQEKQFELFHIAKMLPYVQGFLLYGLALIFPFFALLLLIPGRAGGFFVWFLLWAWTKTWDLGWTLVGILENFFWQMLPHNSVYDPLTDPNHGPISVFESAFDGDPSYSLTMYFIIISSLVLAVPLFSAQLFLGAHSQLITPLIQGFQAVSRFLGASALRWASVEQQIRFDNLRENFLVQETKNRVGSSGLRNISNPHIKRFQESMAEKIGGEIARLENDVPPGGLVNFEQSLQNIFGPRPGGGAIQSMRKEQAQVSLRQLQNQINTQLVKYNISANYYDLARSEEYQTLDAIRGGLSMRGEHFNFTDTANMLWKDVNVSQIDADLAAINTPESYWGTLAVINRKGIN